jgi:hypothetical protein
MSAKSVERAVEYLKRMMCEECGNEFPLEEASLYRHVKALLALPEEPPSEIVPAHIVECIISDLYPVGPLSENTEEGRRAAAEWAYLLYRDFFGEVPTTGEEDGYLILAVSVNVLLHGRLAGQAGRLPPGSLTR